MRLQRTARRRDRGLPPAQGRRAGDLRADRRTWSNSAAPRARSRSPKQSSVNFIKRIVAGPGDTISIVEGHVIRNGKREKDSYIRAMRREPGVQLPDADQDSRRSLVHDGRQPWRIRRQQVLGTGPHRMDHRRSLRHLLASRPDRHPLARSAERPGRRSGPAQPPPVGARAGARAATAAAGGCSPSTAASACAWSPAPTRPGAAASPGRSWRRACCSTTTRSRPASCAR